MDHIRAQLAFDAGGENAGAAGDIGASDAPLPNPECLFDANIAAHRIQRNQIQRTPLRR
ncbi:MULTISPECIES: hypothetical protein [unclassified Nocardia]|uniref:hypothetical protein n=1 Tax=unclassified Nocardia TaxID=2637762 RepID=UPI00343C0BEC